MPQTLCDICGARAASVRVTVLQDGERRDLDVCDFHYVQLTRHQRYISPLESLFGNGLFDQPGATASSSTPSLHRGRLSSAHDRNRIEQHFSDQAKEILQRSAERAVQFGSRDVDTEHLLYELPESDVVQTLLKQHKISAEDIRAYIDTNATRRESAAATGPVQLGVSPRVKSALDRAFGISREMGHSYVGPEHILLGLADVPDSFAGMLLARFGLTSHSLLQHSLRVVGKGEEPGRAGPTVLQKPPDLTTLAAT